MMPKKRIQSPSPRRTLSTNSALYAEVYRTLRTNLQFVAKAHDAKVILITSSMAKEGKSTVVGNLGAFFAESGSRTLIIDADLRNPVLHHTFQVSNVNGLSNLLIEESQKEDCIQSVTIPNLELISCGTIPPNPSQLLNNRRFDTLVEDLRSSYDYIFIDSPPLLAVADALVITRVVDGVTFLIDTKVTNRKMVQMALSSLQKIDAPILGIILNRFRKKIIRHGYY